MSINIVLSLNLFVLFNIYILRLISGKKNYVNVFVLISNLFFCLYNNVYYIITNTQLMNKMFYSLITILIFYFLIINIKNIFDNSSPLINIKKGYKYALIFYQLFVSLIILVVFLFEIKLHIYDVKQAMQIKENKEVFSGEVYYYENIRSQDISSVVAISNYIGYFQKKSLIIEFKKTNNEEYLLPIIMKLFSIYDTKNYDGELDWNQKLSLSTKKNIVDIFRIWVDASDDLKIKDIRKTKYLLTKLILNSGLTEQEETILINLIEKNNQQYFGKIICNNQEEKDLINVIQEKKKTISNYLKTHNCKYSIANHFYTIEHYNGKNSE